MKGMMGYVSEVWKRRYFWLSLAKLDLSTRYRGSMLGIGWSLLNPLATTGVYCLIFGTIFEVDLRNYIPFLLAGLAAWNFLSASILEGCNSVRQAEKFMRVYPAPVAIYGLRTLCGQSFHFLVTLSVTIVFSWILLGFGNLACLVFLIPAVAILIIFCWSVIMFLGIVDVYFPDNRYMLQIILQLVFYTVPVIYPPEAFRIPILRSVIEYNPLSAMIILIRDPIVNMTVPAPETWLIAIGTTAVLFTIVAKLIQRSERYLVLHL